MPERRQVCGDTRALLKRLDSWRASRRGRDRIPEEIWEEAAALAVRDGILFTSRALRLDYAKLKERVAAARTADYVAEPREAGLPVGLTVPERNEQATRFIEWVTTGAAADIGECVVHVRSERCTEMRIELKRISASALSEFVRELLA